MRYAKATTTDQVPEGGKLKAAVEDKTLLITNIGGAYYAIDNRCPHMGGSLYDGKLEGDTVTCPRHKSVFSVKSGEVIQNGNIAFIRLKVSNAKAYPVKIEGEDLLVGFE
jgi:3-phenylpropionate/trans-cinnamate dioxygenase ferredoxin subunit